MKIIHTADIQIKNREKNLYSASLNTLKQIENVLIKSEAEIYVIAGDLVEYATPTESERQLIYNHISRVLNIESLKEVVVITGNHDLIKDKKQTENNIGYNLVSVFSDLIKTLDFELASKLNYIKNSGIFPSKACSKINWIIYSLEDEGHPNFDLEVIDSTKLNICLFHAMIKEYVDSVKLPVRSDIYNELISIEVFPENTLILAGDIHKNLLFEGLNGQSFIYPGSPMEHTHNEGSFITISETVSETVEAETKSVKSYSFDETLDKIELNNIQTYDEFLVHSVCYHTIELDPKIPWEIIKNNLKNLLIEYGNVNTFIKVKSSNIFIKQEREIFEILHNLSSKDNQIISTIQVYFEYDKFVQNSITTDNKIILEIMEQKTQELNLKEGIDGIQNTNKDLILGSENIDDLILNADQLGKLFESILDTTLNGVSKNFDNDITKEDIRHSIKSLFEEQLLNTLNSDSKRYNILFESIETNGFMSLGANRIELNIPGITRILGTNGIGKTTLYNMVRWVITGFVFSGMSKANAVKNNLLVFNKKLIDVDMVLVKMPMIINDSKIVITRTASRNWKNNTTDEQKNQLNWKTYISSVDRTFKLEIYKTDGTITTYTGDQAEKAMINWFGQTIDNILFLNSGKIENILQLPSEKLNELILNFIGVDYLKRLEQNLDSVKSILAKTKPKKNREEIQTDLIDNKIYLEKAENELSLTDDALQSLEKVETDETEIVETTNNELLSIGNIPEQLNENLSSINDTEKYLDNFEIKIKKDTILFDQIAPVLDQKTIDFHTELLFNVDKENTLSKDLKKEKSNEIVNFLSGDLQIFINEQNMFFNEQIEQFQEKIDIIDTKIKDNFKQAQIDIETTLSQLKDKKELKYLEQNKAKNEKFNLLNEIKGNNKELISGVCEKCNKPLSDHWEEHKVTLETKKDTLQIKLEEISKTIEEQQILLDKIDTFILKYSKYRDLLIREDNDIFDKQIKSLESYFINITELHDERIPFNNELIIFTEKRVLWEKAELIKYNNYVVCDDFPLNKDLLNFVEKHKNLLLETKTLDETIQDNNAKISSIKEIIHELTTAHNELLTKYQKLLDINISLNSDINIHNNDVNEHNSLKLIKENQLLTLNSSNIVLKEKLIIYDETKTKLIDYKKCLNESRTEINKVKHLIETLKLRVQSYTNNKLNIQKEYNDLLEYLKNNLIWSVYSKLIKTQFKEIVFEYYRNYLNNTLNYLLENVNFKLFWNNDSELYMIDYKNGICSYQPVQQSSGMETCFLGLSLIYTIHLLNVKNTVSHIFIDEISGTLNKGKELTYEASNYQELLVLILSKFTNKSVFIIDHNITNMFESLTYEVQPSENGSKYIVL